MKGWEQLEQCFQDISLSFHTGLFWLRSEAASSTQLLAAEPSPLATTLAGIPSGLEAIWLPVTLFSVGARVPTHPLPVLYFYSHL